MPIPLVDTIEIVRVKKKEDFLTALLKAGREKSVEVIPMLYWYGSNKLRITVCIHKNNYYTLESIIPDSVKDHGMVKDLMYDELCAQMDSLVKRFDLETLQNGSA